MTHAETWTDATIARLLDTQTCPVCGQATLASGRCPACRADLNGRIGNEVWTASVTAARALRERQRLIASAPVSPSGPLPVPQGAPLPTGMQPVGPPGLEALPAPAVGVAGGTPTAGTPPVSPPRIAASASTGATLQSVVATAGAGLFAVAAIVFTFFNPDLADRASRNTVIGIVTVVFLAGAWLLARRRLQFSAEAVGGLGLVFVGLDVNAIAQIAAPAAGAWTLAAVGTVVAGGLMLGAALLSGIRTWLWVSLISLALTPAMLGAGVDDGFSAVVGRLATAFAGLALCAALPALARRLRSPGGAEDEAPSSEEGAPALGAVLRAERVSLTVLQLVAAGLAVIGALLAGAPSGTIHSLRLAAILAGVCVLGLLAARHLLPRLWSLVAGVAAASAAASVASALAGTTPWGSAASAAAMGVVLALTALIPLPRGAARADLAGGALGMTGLFALPALAQAMAVGASVVLPFLAGLLRAADAWTTLGWGGDRASAALTLWPHVAALAAFGAGFAVFAVLARRREELPGLRTAALITGTSLLGIAGLVIAAHPALPIPVRVAVAVGLPLLTAVVLTARRVPAPIRIPLLIGAHLALVVSVMVAWLDRPLVPAAGAATLLALAATALTVTPRVRFVYSGAGYAYALMLVSTALSLAGVSGIALLCLTASAGLVGAIAATFLPRIGARSWQAVLVVATVPFAIGIAQVVFERSGWTALSTGLMFALALSLLLTRRPGLTALVRTAAAAMLVPALSVVVVCLGAQLLPQSGSPVVLPVVAAIVAIVLAGSALIRDGLVTAGRGRSAADAARVAIEASALVTAVIAVLLALLRTAAGLGTACVVLLILGAGALAAAAFAGRRYGWGLAGAAFTGALWSVWGLAGVTLPEAYLLPPALGAALIALVLTLRGASATALFAAGLGIAALPLLALVAVGADDTPWRAFGLLASGWVLVSGAALIGHARVPALRRLRPLRVAAAVVGGGAAVAGTIQAVRWGRGMDPLPVEGAAAVFLACLGIAALSGVALLIAAHVLATALPVLRTEGEERTVRAARWLTAPALLAFAIGVWPSIARDWFVIWAMWALMLGWLVLVVVAASRRRTALPPVWFLFGIAFITAVVAWSPRDLRVEMFSLPLGVFLLAAGVIGLRGRTSEREEAPSVLADWPHGWSGSWPLLAPGLIVMMSASVVSTFTDPLTWRAILVMVLALAAILLGASRRLAAPFVIGLVALPVENVFVFSVQLGRGIESMPWWITLAVIGAVLLIIAVAGERREGADRSVAARMRDLR